MFAPMRPTRYPFRPGSFSLQQRAELGPIDIVIPHLAVYIPGDARGADVAAQYSVDPAQIRTLNAITNEEVLGPPLDNRTDAVEICETKS